MRFLIKLCGITRNAIIPINYSYPLSSALYRILEHGDTEYAAFLHEQGYGKGFKLFSFSQINCPFKIEGDRMRLLSDELSFEVAFHLPQAMESFVRGLFQSEKIDIADSHSKAQFRVKSVEGMTNPLQPFKENEIVNLQLKPLGPLVVGLRNEKGMYDFLAPEDPRFTESLIYNWRQKIGTCFENGHGALLLLKMMPRKSTPKSRLITIKANTPEETKIRGWVNFDLKVTAEKRHVELLLNAGAGLYNAQGMGCLGVVELEGKNMGGQAPRRSEDKSYNKIDV